MKNFTAQNPIAYFSAEFGVKKDLPVYSGGLGVLAGDIMKEAADLNWPMYGVGLLYRGEEMAQTITMEGNQVEVDNFFDPHEAGLKLVMDGDNPLYIKVHLTQMDVWVQAWELKLGENCSIFFLDPNNERNHSHERRLANALYAGTQEEIIKQQLILGIGGVKLLTALGIKPGIYHLNEGRPTFLHWQLIRTMMDHEGMTYEEAATAAKEKTVYTNHTLVAAGNQAYDVDYMRVYGKYYSKKMGITIEELLKPGIKDDKFDVTTFALNVSRKTSSVSELHYELCKKNWPEYNWCNVTNAVHMPTWQEEKFRSVDLEGNEIWDLHLEEKRKTAAFIEQTTGFSYDPNKLVISWARRVAKYKQLDLLFKDIKALQDILLSTDRPVQLLVAGKAHVFDNGGKQIIREVIGYMSQELAGHALFIPNYNIDIGKALTRGSDVWINTPVWGEEASGTSGMKAIANGVIQCTVPDGWCAAIDWSDESIGFPLDPKDTAASFYETMQNKVVPTFYDRDENDIPVKWVSMMRNSIKLSDRYKATRMMLDYENELYE
ncbi:MAG: alpha-glucan family phosphorylase [Pseudomonadales bacterium]|jgi:starch phosphorylase|nr:alpha-glucan family phosphorylase [Pseudomonadales bacterium]